MTALQKRQLQNLEELVSAMVAELSPRIILPTEDKQAALGIAEETLLIPVAKRRAITLNANLDGGWSVKEFDTSAGTLIPVWEHESELGGELIIEVVLAAAVKSLKEQLAVMGEDAVAVDERPQLTQIYKLLQARHATLLADGLASFEFEPIVDDKPAEQDVVAE
jgi:hypothetical protein